MKHIKIYEDFLNEAKDDGLFPSQGKNSNKFLFGGNSDTIVAPMKRVKIPPATASSNISVEPVGNNYNFQALANELREWEFYYERGRVRYDIYPVVYFTIPRVAKVECMDYIKVEPIANLRTSAFSGTGDGTDFNYHWYSGNAYGRGPAWATGSGGSVKIDTVGIKGRLESVVGNSIRAAAVDRINWKKINAMVQYKGEEPRLFDPSSNQKDLSEWVGGWGGDGMWNRPNSYNTMNSYENTGEFWSRIEPAVKQLEGMLPSEITVKIKTITK
jgi:hypothetical protein